MSSSVNEQRFFEEWNRCNFSQLKRSLEFCFNRNDGSIGYPGAAVMILNDHDKQAFRWYRELPIEQEPIEGKPRPFDRGDFCRLLDASLEAQRQDLYINGIDGSIW